MPMRLKTLYQRIRRRLKGYRTFVFNAFWLVVSAMIAVAPEVLNYFATFQWGIVVTPRTAALIGMAVFMANMILRKLTTTPIGDNGEAGKP